MRHLASRLLLSTVSVTSGVHAQSEATFPIPNEAQEQERTEPTTPSVPEQENAPDPEAEETPDPPEEAAAEKPTQPNPYVPEAPPPGPPPPMPGNPYGTVPHRPPTPETNPYVGGPPAAAVVHSEAPETIEKTNWSVGGGLAVETPDSLNTTGYDVYYPRALRFTSSLLFERRLSPTLHLLAQPIASYQKSKSRPPTSDEEPSSFEELRMGFEGGLRWVATPGAPVELGMSHLLFVEFNQLLREGERGILRPGYKAEDVEQVVLGLSNSFIAERRLIPHLWLRLGVGLLGFDYTSTKATFIDEVEDDDGDTFETEDDTRTHGFRVALSPSLALQLRLTF